MKYLILFLFCLTAQADQDISWLKKNFGNYNVKIHKSAGPEYLFAPWKINLSAKLDRDGNVNYISITPIPGQKENVIPRMQGDRFVEILQDSRKFRNYNIKYWNHGGTTYTTITPDRKWTLVKEYAKGLKLYMIVLYKNRPDFVSNKHD
jgi:hypothetical protein